MDERDLNQLARQAGQYPPPQLGAEERPETRDSLADTQHTHTWSDRIDNLIVLFVNLFIALVVFALKLSGLALLFWGAFALYPDDFLKIPFAQMTFGNILSFIGSCMLALLGVWLSILWLQVKKISVSDF
jgi:hypothetical protein